MDTLSKRVFRLEGRVDEQAALRAAQDRDLSDVRETLRGHGRVLQALATSQSEHTVLLREQGAVIERLETIQQEHTRILLEHTTALHEQGTMLREIIGMLHRITDERPSPN